MDVAVHQPGEHQPLARIEDLDPFGGVVLSDHRGDPALAHQDGRRLQPTGKRHSGAAHHEVHGAAHGAGVVATPCSSATANNSATNRSLFSSLMKLASIELRAKRHRSPAVRSRLDATAM